VGKNKYLKQILLLFFLSYFFFMLGNGALNLTNNDEVFYTQTAKEMIQHRAWLVPYMFGQPQFEKPILTYWLLRIGFIIFGGSGFGMRFFPALFAAVGVIITYLLGLLIFNPPAEIPGLKPVDECVFSRGEGAPAFRPRGSTDGKKAFLSGLILMSSVLYVGLARTVLTDMVFSIFILLALASFLWGYYRQDRKLLALLLFFAFAGLATLTKGPLGFLVPFLVVLIFLFIRRDMKFLYCMYSFLGLFIFALIAVPWYVFMIQKFGRDFTHEFFYNDHILRILKAEHIKNDTWYFYPATMIAGMFPWSLFVAAALAFLPKKIRRQKGAAYPFFACWICVTFLVFQVAHSKLISYIFPAFPALALIAGDFIYDKDAADKRSRLPFFIAAANIIMVLLIPVAIAVGINIEKYSAYLPTKIPFYCLIALFLALITAMALLLLRNKPLKNVYAMALIMPLFLCIIGYERDDINPYESSKAACEYLLKNYKVDNTILCSKFFVRGVRYYTDKEVAVIDVPGEQFFSPHPIPFLNSDQKVRGFLNSQAVTYCIVKRASKEDIERVIGKEFKYEVLNKIGNEYILRIARR